MRIDEAVRRLGAPHHPVGEVHVVAAGGEQPLGGAVELLEEAVRCEDGDADMAALVAADVRLPLLHPRQVVDVVERVALRPADHDVAVRDHVLAEHAVDEDRRVDVLDGSVRPQQIPHLVLEPVEEDLGDEVVVLPRHAVGVGSVDAEHLGRDPEQAAAVHPLVVLLRHQRARASTRTPARRGRAATIRPIQSSTTDSAR